MENKNLPEIEEIKKPKIFTKGFFIGLIITLIITSLIGGLVILQEVYVLGKTFESQGMVIMIDAFSVSGGLVCLFYLLCFVSDEGAFDAISYSVQLVWHMTFHKNIRETKLPASYAEYRLLKRSKPRTNLLYMLFSGLTFFIIGLILLIIYRV